MPVGHPSMYKPEFCNKVIELGKKGYALSEMAAELGVTRKTIYEWLKQPEKAEFAEAMERAQELSLAWWQSQERKGIWEDPGGKKLNASAFKWATMNRFREEYVDSRSHEHTGPGGGPIENKWTVEICRPSSYPKS